MKSIALVIASLFAVSAFAQAPSGTPGKAEAKPAVTAPAKTEIKKEEKKPAKSVPAKDEKAAAPAAKPASK